MGLREMAMGFILKHKLLSNQVPEDYPAPLEGWISVKAKKTIKKNLENTALLYQQYGLSFSYNLDDSYHAGQFDKVMNFLLEVEESEDDTTNDVVYKHIVVKTETEDK